MARLQTDIVIAQLKAVHNDIDFEIAAIKTAGDKILHKPIAQLGTRGVFVKELEEALLADEVDFVVHSLKDLPTVSPAGLIVPAILSRADARDVLVAGSEWTLATLPGQCRVATSSRRRTAQLKAVRPDLEFVDIRGNIQTRLRKLEEGQCEAIILAAAGLLRLDLGARINQYIDFAVSLPAAGQGALAVQCRQADPHAASLLAAINEPLVEAEVAAERAFLDSLGGGCSVPVGAYCCSKASGRLHLQGCVASLDGMQVLRAEMEGEVSEARELGKRLAGELVAKGAADIIAEFVGTRNYSVSPP